MTDDIVYRIHKLFNSDQFKIPEYELRDYVLYELEKILNMNSSSLKNYHLPLPKESLLDDLNNKLLRDELNYDTNQLKE